MDNREIDKLIAEKVMRWRVIPPSVHEGTGFRNQGYFVVLLFPLTALVWLSRWIDDYGSEFIYWIDNAVETICWHYVRWRK